MHLDEERKLKAITLARIPTRNEPPESSVNDTLEHSFPTSEVSVNICFLSLLTAFFPKRLTETCKKRQVCFSSENQVITRTVVPPTLLKAYV